MSFFEPEKIKQAQFITSGKKLQSLVEQNRDVPLIAVDIESNSMFAYYEQVCLIQITIVYPDGKDITLEDFIIDPLVIDDISPLGQWFADPSVEILFHAGEYDILSLKRDFGFEFVNLFDTYIAARTLGYNHVSLQALLEDTFSIRLDKRYQQANWSKRPLPEKQLFYAQMDTHYLPALRDHFLNELSSTGLLAEAQEYFDELAHVIPTEKIFDHDGFWRIQTPHRLEDHELAILQELYLWRERTAEQRNLPPYKILRNSTLVDIALAAPSTHDDLFQIKNLSKKEIQRHSYALLRAIENGRHRPPPKQKSHPRPDDKVLTRFRALHKWRKRKAFDRGVDSDIILTKQALWALAHVAPQSLKELEGISALGEHRRQLYATELLAVLARHPN